ncbi:MAG: type II toxin-antitoxin system ParD family antitoxin [Pseudomonadota bacterium]
MATTSFSLGEYWETYLREEVASGRYQTISEVIRDALRERRERQETLERLRAHLAVGEAQLKRGEFVANSSLETIMAKLDTKRSLEKHSRS